MSVLNPEVVCEDCQVRWTSDNEWVMDTYRCNDFQEFCLNCCGCEDHDTTENGVWYAPKEEIVKMAYYTVTLYETIYHTVEVEADSEEDAIDTAYKTVTGELTYLEYETESDGLTGRIEITKESN